MKTYPFNGTKHAHKIEHRITVIENKLVELENTPGAENWTLYDRLEAERDVLEPILTKVSCGGIIRLTGAEHAIASKCVSWDAERKASKAIRKEFVS